ncbi:hypothetical protein ACVIIW_006900 [Bradyrhizobium sp. USDA 4449]
MAAKRKRGDAVAQAGDVEDAVGNDIARGREALNANGELVSGDIAAPAPGDVALRMERLGLVLVDNVTPVEGGAAGG